MHRCPSDGDVFEKLRLYFGKSASGCLGTLRCQRCAAGCVVIPSPRAEKLFSSEVCPCPGLAVELSNPKMRSTAPQTAASRQHRAAAGQAVPWGVGSPAEVRRWERPGPMLPPTTDVLPGWSWVFSIFRTWFWCLKVCKDRVLYLKSPTMHLSWGHNEELTSPFPSCGLLVGHGCDSRLEWWTRAPWAVPCPALVVRLGWRPCGQEGREVGAVSVPWRCTTAALRSQLKFGAAGAKLTFVLNA